MQREGGLEEVVRRRREALEEGARCCSHCDLEFLVACDFFVASVGAGAVKLCGLGASLLCGQACGKKSWSRSGDLLI